MLDAPSDSDVVFELGGVEVVVSPLDHKRIGDFDIDWLGDPETGFFWIRRAHKAPKP
ncbi:MAG: hypothetical protein KC912_18595 [Proteobacteria bacterium]|nr:hypothetical protein [Pseudomonadota bacterium]